LSHALVVIIPNVAKTTTTREIFMASL
jgi:hypothetical protein